MNALAMLIMGFFMTLLGLLGLFMAAGATDDTIYWVGFLFFGFAVAFIFSLVHKATAGD